MGERAWRGVCRAAAAAQAAEEARQAWPHVTGALPFDYRWEHVTQVVGLAQRLGRATGADAEVVEAAAWLHDVRKELPSHGQAGAAAARVLLAGTDFPPEKVGAVADAIRLHVGLYRSANAPLEPLEAAVLWDADKLSKLGAQAVMLTLSTAAVQGMDLVQRWRYITEFVETVLSRTVTSMNTRPGRRMAERRYRTMLSVLSLWAREMREMGVEFEGEFTFEIPSDYDGMSEE